MLLLVSLFTLAAVACTDAASVKCVITRDGHVTTFDGRSEKVPAKRVNVVEWNPGKNDCKFKLRADFSGGYQWTGFAVGPHRRALKYFRAVDFDKVPGQVWVHGWQMKGSNKIQVTSTTIDLVYGKVKPVIPFNKYLIDATRCANVGEPDYKMTYNFQAADNEPLITIKLDATFYANNKTSITGGCLRKDEWRMV